MCALAEPPSGSSDAPIPAFAHTLIDWDAPWLRPYFQVSRPVRAALEQGHSVAEALDAARQIQQIDPAPGIDGADLIPRFVAQQALPPGEAYESFIHRCNGVPTRDNLHDFFNGLVWYRFPALKRRLNALHAARIALDGVGSTRGALRDALTLFDENGALLLAPATLIEALRRRDWRTLFVERRADWQRAHLTLIGHALLEKLLAPRKAITAHVWVVAEGADAVASLQAERLMSKPFLPLPVLGVPGWWKANEQDGFYDDATVFRPPPAHADTRLAEDPR